MRKTAIGLIMFLIGMFILSTININCLGYQHPDDVVHIEIPQQGEIWHRGETHEIKWRCVGSNAFRPTRWDVYLVFADTRSPQYELYQKERIKLATVDYDYNYDGNYTWTIPLDLPESSSDGYSFDIEGTDRWDFYGSGGSIYILDPGEELVTSPDDEYWLSRAIMSEASVGTQQEQIAVGWCVLNRFNDGRFGDSLEGVIYDGFAYNQQPTQQIKELANEILKGLHPDPTDGAVFFFSPRSMPKEGENTTGYDVGGGPHTYCAWNIK
ncbi:MAG: cell wall hydrolase [Thermoplasmatales archaeon]|nr:cell wall hydrolase [Thermoplasmatales archaeon]